MGRRDGASLDGVFCASCGMYNERGSTCRVCGASLKASFEPEFGTWDSDADEVHGGPVAPDSVPDSAPGESPVGTDPSASAECPECGFRRTSSHASCPQCGHESPLQIWRKGGDVIARKGAAFTHACVVCGSTDNLETVTGRNYAGIEQGSGDLSADLKKIVEMFKRGFSSTAYELRLALCPRHITRRKRIESSRTWVSAAAIGSIMKTGIGSADYHRFRGMNKGFRETLPEWEGTFPPPAKGPESA